MGHIDHGKSTLLDYIRKTNVVAGEAGGITQHLSAYEIDIPYQGTNRKITFLDTPGHAAFTGMRERGASAADIAVLVVSAEDGVKAQTIEALDTIRASTIPFIVAINKIDRPEANIERTKQMLAEQGVLVEGYGGTVPWVALSALKGTGVSELLDTILLVADLEGMASDARARVKGVVIESHLDNKRGIAATIIIKEGTLQRGQFVVAGDAIATTRIMENFLGTPLAAAGPGTPLQLVGFDHPPTVGASITVFDKKRDAEKYVQAHAETSAPQHILSPTDEIVVPLIIKSDTFGTIEAIEHELAQLHVEGLRIKIIGKGVGAIGERDIRLAQSDPQSIILGFNVDLDARAKEINEVARVHVELFTIIYKLTEWLAHALEERRPRVEIKEVIGTAKVIKLFSQSRDRQVIGCRIGEGMLSSGAKVNVIRRDFPIATGTIVEIQQAKQRVKEVSAGECGLSVECKNEIAVGDTLEAFVMQRV